MVRKKFSEGPGTSRSREGPNVHGLVNKRGRIGHGGIPWGPWDALLILIRPVCKKKGPPKPHSDTLSI